MERALIRNNNNNFTQSKRQSSYNGLQCPTRSVPITHATTILTQPTHPHWPPIVPSMHMPSSCFFCLEISFPRYILAKLPCLFQSLLSSHLLRSISLTISFAASSLVPAGTPDTVVPLCMHLFSQFPSSLIYHVHYLLISFVVCLTG